MFTEKITTQPIPERVFSLYLTVKEKTKIKRKDLQELLLPKEVNKSEDNDYFKNCLMVAEELHLVRQEGSVIYLDSQVSNLNTIEEFRKYVNSILVKEFSNGPFCMLTKSLYDAGRTILKYESVTEMRELLSNDIKTDNYTMNGWRFWGSFLGFGILTMHGGDNTGFIPNCYQFLLDILPYTSLQKGKQYSIDEFINELVPFASIIINNRESKTFNYGMSCALRILNDSGIIKLTYINDQKSEWLLDKLEIHSIVERVSHITVL